MSLRWSPNVGWAICSQPVLCNARNATAPAPASASRWCSTGACGARTFVVSITGRSRSAVPSVVDQRVDLVAGHGDDDEFGVRGRRRRVSRRGALRSRRPPLDAVGIGGAAAEHDVVARPGPPAARVWPTVPAPSTAITLIAYSRASAGVPAAAREPCAPFCLNSSHVSKYLFLFASSER